MVVSPVNNVPGDSSRNTLGNIHISLATAFAIFEREMARFVSRTCSPVCSSHSKNRCTPCRVFASSRQLPMKVLEAFIAHTLVGRIEAVKDCDILLVLSNGNAGWAKNKGDIGICHAELMTGLSQASGKVSLVSLGNISLDAHVPAIPFAAFGWSDLVDPDFEWFSAKYLCCLDISFQFFPQIRQRRTGCSPLRKPVVATA